MKLKTLPLSGIKDVRFIIKCCVKNTIKNAPERAIINFLPIEELSIVIQYLEYKNNTE